MSPFQNILINYNYNCKNILFLGMPLTSYVTRWCSSANLYVLVDGFQTFLVACVSLYLFQTPESVSRSVSQSLRWSSNKDVGFEVLTAVVLKSTIFWDITPCRPLKVNRCFGGTYRVHRQGRRISRSRNQRESKWQEKPCVLFLRNVSWLSTDYMALYPSRFFSSVAKMLGNWWARRWIEETKTAKWS
jgi:hypothetical protein